MKDLQRIASETGVAIVIVHHLRKSSANGAETDPSLAFTGVASVGSQERTVDWLFELCPSSPNCKPSIMPSKSAATWPLGV